VLCCAIMESLSLCATVGISTRRVVLSPTLLQLSRLPAALSGLTHTPTAHLRDLSVAGAAYRGLIAAAGYSLGNSPTTHDILVVTRVALSFVNPLTLTPLLSPRPAHTVFLNTTTTTFLEPGTLPRTPTGDTPCVARSVILTYATSCILDNPSYNTVGIPC